MAVTTRREGESIFVDGVDVKRAARTLRSIAEAPGWKPPSDLNQALEVFARMLGFPNLHALNAASSEKSPSGQPQADHRQRDYAESMRALVMSDSTSFTLRKRLMEDEGRDQLESLQDAEKLVEVQRLRFAQGSPIGSVKVLREGGVEEQGVAALKRLYVVATGHSGQCRHIARFLLGLYAGHRFEFDLTNLRAIDTALYEDCIRVLNMDARLTKREVHQYFENGSQKWEALALDWRVVDGFQLRNAAKRLAERVGTSGPAGEAAADLLAILEGKHASE